MKISLGAMDSSRSQKEKMDKAKEVISNILDEEKEYKLRELDMINEKLQQTEEQLDKLRSYLLGCLYTDQPEDTKVTVPKRYPIFEDEVGVRTRRIIIGNVSKYIPADQRDKMSDQFTYKWLLYVRTPPGQPAIETFVSRVVFKLDPSYIPNDIVELTEAPFEVRRRGWGEFPVQVKIFFANEDKEIDITHQLNLDTTFSGVQTPGAETIVDVEFGCYADEMSRNRIKGIKRSNGRTQPQLIT